MEVITEKKFGQFLHCESRKRVILWALAGEHWHYYSSLHIWRPKLLKVDWLICMPIQAGGMITCLHINCTVMLDWCFEKIVVPSPQHLSIPLKGQPKGPCACITSFATQDYLFCVSNQEESLKSTWSGLSLWLGMWWIQKKPPFRLIWRLTWCYKLDPS